ncbi:MAG: hypothetical protein DRO40_11400, partial [Thermoprotei archaeon]
MPIATLKVKSFTADKSEFVKVGNSPYLHTWDEENPPSSNYIYSNAGMQIDRYYLFETIPEDAQVTKVTIQFFSKANIRQVQPRIYIWINGECKETIELPYGHTIWSWTSHDISDIYSQGSEINATSIEIDSRLYGAYTVTIDAARLIVEYVSGPQTIQKSLNVSFGRQKNWGLTDYARVIDYDEQKTDWEMIGKSPYLDKEDYPDNYVRTTLGNNYSGYYYFENLPSSVSIKSCTLEFRAMSGKTIKVWLYRDFAPGTMEWLVPPSTYSFQWHRKDLTDFFKTYEQVNSSSLLFMLTDTFEDPIPSVDAARLKFEFYRRLLISSFSAVQTEWDEHGEIPYLDKIDYPNNYLRSTVKLSKEAYFYFQEIPTEYTSITLVRLSARYLGGTFLIDVFKPGSVSEYTFSPSQGWTIDSKTITSFLSTPEEVNSSKIQIISKDDQEIKIDAVWLDVDYVLTTQKVVKDLEMFEDVESIKYILTSLPPDQDAAVSASSPDTNYGTIEKLRIAQDSWESYIWVTLPTAMRIKSVTIVFGELGAVFGTVYAYDCNSFDEMQVTWNTKPDINTIYGSVGFHIDGRDIQEHDLSPIYQNRFLDAFGVALKRYEPETITIASKEYTDYIGVLRFKVEGYGPLIKERSLQHFVREFTRSEKDLQFSLKKLVDKVSSFIHNLTAKVSKLLNIEFLTKIKTSIWFSSHYLLSGIVTKIHQLLYSLKREVKQIISFGFDLYSFKRIFLSLRHSLSVLIRQWLSSPFFVKVNVSMFTEMKYKMKELVKRIAYWFYNIQELITISFESIYTLLNKVEQSFFTLFLILKKITQYSSLKYSLLSIVRQFNVIKHFVKNIVSTVFKQYYVLLKNISNEIITQFSILVNRMSLIDFKYFVKTIATRTFVMLNFLRNKLSNQLVSLSKVLKKISQIVVSLFSIIGRIKKVFHTYYLIGYIASRMLGFGYSILSITSRILSTIYWNLKSK